MNVFRRLVWVARSYHRAAASQLVQIGGQFDGLHATQASVSKTCF
jgi:hypothetical protein